MARARTRTPEDFCLAVCPRGEDGVHPPLAGGGGIVVRVQRGVVGALLARSHGTLSALELLRELDQPLLLSRRLVVSARQLLHAGIHRLRHRRVRRCPRRGPALDNGRRRRAHALPSLRLSSLPQRRRQGLTSFPAPTIITTRLHRHEQSRLSRASAIPLRLPFSTPVPIAPVRRRGQGALGICAHRISPLPLLVCVDGSGMPRVRTPRMGR